MVSFSAELFVSVQDQAAFALQPKRIQITHGLQRRPRSRGWSPGLRISKAGSFLSSEYVPQVRIFFNCLRD